MSVRYTVLAPAVQPGAPKSASKLKISGGTLTRRGRTLTLRLRGTAEGTGAVRLRVTGVRGTGRAATARLARGAWKATLRIRVKGRVPRRVVVGASYAGDATHLASTVRRTVASRKKARRTGPPSS